MAGELDRKTSLVMRWSALNNVSWRWGEMIG